MRHAHRVRPIAFDAPTHAKDATGSAPRGRGGDGQRMAAMRTACKRFAAAKTRSRIESTDMVPTPCGHDRLRAHCLTAMRIGKYDIEPLAPSDHVTIRQRQQFDTDCSMKNADICRIWIFWCCVRNFLRKAGRYSYIVHTAARSTAARHGRAWMPGIECRGAVRQCCRGTRQSRARTRVEPIRGVATYRAPRMHAARPRSPSHRIRSGERRAQSPTRAHRP